MFDLSNDVIIVTGGNGGLGLAYARGLVKCGAKVAVWGRNAEKNASALHELKDMGGDVAAYVCDVPNEADVAGGNRRGGGVLHHKGGRPRPRPSAGVGAGGRWDSRQCDFAWLY